MHTVLDIIRHYSGAGKEDKDMTHECEGTKKYNREFVRGTEDWIMIHEHDEYENVDVSTDGIKYCPFCGIEFDYEEWQARRNES